jgi:hypothetical protein
MAYQRAYQRRSAYPAAVDNTIWPVPLIPAGDGDDGRPDSPWQSADFAAGAATIGGAEFVGAGDGTNGDLAGVPGGGDFGGESGGGDSGGSGGDSCGGSSCGGGS